VAGYREFVTGEVLTAANVNQFLMEQTVMTFADATARDTALSGVLREGLIVYNLDDGALERYDGSAWVPAAPETTDASALTSGTLAAGRLPAGTVLNVVQTVKNDTFTTTSTSLTDVPGMAVTITPTSATSKVLVVMQVAYGHSLVEGLILFQLVRGSTNICTSTGGTSNGTVVAPGTSSGFVNHGSVAFLDSPGVATATTYKVQARTGSGTLSFNRVAFDTRVSTVSMITAIEVAV